MADTRVEEAKDAMRRHFVDTRGRPVKTPYHQHHLQVLYEANFFEWVITYALRDLVNEGFLTVLDRENVDGLNRLESTKRLRFYASSDALRDSKGVEVMKRRVLSTAAYVARYSIPQHTSVAGKHLEALVKSHFQILQFRVVGTHTAKYGNQTWSKTDHNLDFVAEKPGTNLAVGVEVKNTLSIMDPKEIDIKIEMCKHLGIVPVFAVRWIKPYINCIQRQGGFGWVFKTQMYPLGYEEFVKRLYTRFSLPGDRGRNAGKKKGFPVAVRTEVPEKPVALFKKWVSEIENDPPCIDTSHRCASRGNSPRPGRT